MRDVRSLFLSLSLPTAAALGACSADAPPCDPEEPGTICTIAGTGVAGYGGDDGPAVDGVLALPMDLALSPDGDLWVLDFNNYLVRAIDAEGHIRSVVGTGLLGDSPEPGETATPALHAGLNHTPDFLFHEGYLYLAAWHNSRIKRVDLATMMVENVAGVGKRTFYYGDGGPAVEAALDLPSSVAIDPEGRVVIMDQANQVIRRIEADGTIDRIVGACIIDLDEPCAEGQEPVTCPGSNKTVCGSLDQCSDPCTPGFDGDGGSAISARLSQGYGQKSDPQGRLLIDDGGTIYFADTENHRLRRVTPDGVIETIAGTGVAGYAGDGGPATMAQLNQPVDIERTADGTIYFTDVFNNCVRKIDPEGIISTVVGRCDPALEGRGFAGDGGPPTEALLDRPYGIYVTGDRLYVADTYNNRVRVVNF